MWERYADKSQSEHLNIKGAGVDELQFRFIAYVGVVASLKEHNDNIFVEYGNVFKKEYKDQELIQLQCKADTRQEKKSNTSSFPTR